MKTILSVASLLILALAMGCKPWGDKPATDTAAQQMDKAQAATKEAARQIKDYSYAQKAEFVAAMKIQLADLDRSLDELAAKIQKSSASARAEAEPKVAALKEQSAQLKKQLAKATDANESAWGTIKAEFEKGYAAVKEGVMNSRQWMSDKIAP
jgi:hypothetical protein